MNLLLVPLTIGLPAIDESLDKLLVAMETFPNVAVLGDECMDAEEFTQILDAGLDAADVAVIPPGYDTVTIGDIERTRLTNIKVMFFAGVNDGIVPKAAGRGGIISQY